MKNIYHDGTLWIVNVPLLTIIVTRRGIGAYHNYEGRQFWFQWR
jgi:hypothetical protein